MNAQGLLELIDVQIPRIGPKELLVKMIVCGICGTDLEKLHGVRLTPPVLGHEVAGQIEEVGDQLQGYSKGEQAMRAYRDAAMAGNPAELVNRVNVVA